MKKTSLLGSTIIQSAAFTGALVLAVPAFAQDAAPAQDDAAAATAEAAQAAEAPAVDCVANPNNPECQAIVVTGSRIRRPNLDSPVPVTQITGEEFFQTGTVSVGDVLNELPALRSTFSQSNSTRFLGTAGLNLLDLRGLGTVRTLVLQNGRRHVGGDVLSSGVTPDVNTIPTDLIERVEVVTGGNSAVYGSDAIAGVVNFILKDDYEGIQVRGQGGISKYGDAGAYFISGLAGTNFADGRGNVAVNVEYARQEQYFGAGRPFIRQNNGFITVDTDSAGTPNGSDGVPDRLFFRDIRSASFGNTGVLQFGGNAALNCGTDPVGNRYNCPYQFLPDGTLVPITGDRIGLGPNGSFVGGNGENFRGGDQFQMSPELKRYNVNLLAHFEVSPAFVPFVEAKYSRTDTFGTGSSGPAFISGTTLADPSSIFFGLRNRERFRLDNPYLSAQARAQITALRTQLGLTSTDATTLSLRLNMTGLGNRAEEARRETYRIVGGVRGDFWDDWNYEIAVNYGKLREETKVLGNLDVQRFLLAMDAVRDPNTGQIVCRSQIDPAAQIGYFPWAYNYFYGPTDPRSDPNADARLARDVAACTPVNPFGGNFTQAQRDYLLLDTTSIGRTKQFNVAGFIGGNTGKFLNLPGGPISFVFGGEYRTDNLFYQQDRDVELGYTFYNAIPTFRAPKSKVKEVFGEIRIPILKDVPFFHELEISGAGRISDYSIGNTGSVKAYNASLIWSPVKDIRFRGNYARSVRAPNQVELFSPFGQNFAPGFADPCSARNIGNGTANRVTNCQAAGLPAGYDFVYSQSLEIQSGGNPNLQAETADSWTVGAVIQPRWVPGLSLSVDWYKITVNQVISGVAAQTIVNQCYDLPAGNPFCDLFQRAGASGGPRGEIPFQILEGSLIQGPVNFARLVAKGIDVEAAYRTDIAGIGKLDTSLNYTHVLDRSNYLSPTSPNFQNVIVGKNGGELGDPEDAFNWSTNLTTGNITFGYQMRYISAMFLNNYEDFNEVQGRPPENADWADRQKYPAVFYHDVRLGFDLNKKYSFYAGVDNLTNKQPPLGLTGIGGGSGIYDSRGRFFYAGFQAKF